MKISRKLLSLMLVVILFVGIFPMSAFAKEDIVYGIGFTTGSGLRLRSEPSTSSKTIATAPKDQVVVVLAKTGDWYKVIYNLKEGYMHEDYVSVLRRENAELGYGKVTGSRVNMRSGASTSKQSVGMSSAGDKVYIIGINDGWYKVIWNSKICYIRSDFVDLTEIPYENKASSKSPIFFRGGKSTGTPVSAAALNGGTTGSTDSNTTKPESNTKPETNTPTVSPSDSPLADQIVALAKKQLGIPYKWGEESPSKGFDCSGLVYYVLRTLGVDASRNMATLYKQGTYVPKSELQPGDIVFFQNTYKGGLSHVGIYVGNGKFIHAPQSGQVVSYADLNSNYYTNHYYGARRYS